MTSRIARGFVGLASLLSFAIAIDFAAHWMSLRAADRAPPCHGDGEDDFACNVPATVVDVPRCAREACRIKLQVAIHGATLTAPMLVGRGELTELHAGDKGTLQLFRGQPIALHGEAGAVVQRWDTFAREHETLELQGAIAFALGLLLATAWRASSRHTTAGASAPLTRADMARYGARALLLVGAATLAGAVLLGRARAAEARAQAAAPPCPSGGGADCVGHGDATVTRTFCDTIDARFCMLTLRISDGAAADRLAEIDLAVEDTQKLRAAGNHARVELFNGAVTRIDIGGASVTPHGTAAAAASMLRILTIVAALMMLAGLVGTLRLRRREAQA